MDFAVIWTDPALVDFESAIRFLLERNPAAAESQRLAILDHVELLDRMPFMGSPYEPDRTGRVRETVCGKYRIFYRVNEIEKTVEILTVWHGSRAEPDLPE